MSENVTEPDQQDAPDAPPADALDARPQGEPGTAEGAEATTAEDASPPHTDKKTPRAPAPKKAGSSGSAAKTTSAKKSSAKKPTSKSSLTTKARDEGTPRKTPAAEQLAERGEPVTDAAQTTAPSTGGIAPAVALVDVAKVYGAAQGVRALSFEVPVGSLFAIVGPNGAGKTTTLSLLSGLARPDHGSVAVAGFDVVREAERARAAIGILPDRLRTFTRLTGKQLLYYYGALRGLDARVIEERTGHLARAFDLHDALGRVVSDYSVGMTKKIMLAGAMIHSPRVLVLDEPFESVDPQSTDVILEVLRSYVSHGGTVVMSSHGMRLIESVCDRVVVIVDGSVVAQGTVDEIRDGKSLEQRYVELVGTRGDVEGLSWLHDFSD